MTPKYRIGIGRARHKVQHNRFTNKEDSMAQVVITYDEGEYKVESPYDEDWKMFAKEKGAQWDPHNRTWDFPDDDMTLQELEKEVERFFPRATIILG